MRGSRFFALFIIFSLFIFKMDGSAQTSQNKSWTDNSVILMLGSGKAFVNNKAVSIDSENSNITPINKDGRTLVPVRFIAESLGAKVEWDNKTRVVSIVLNGSTVSFKIDENKISINSKVTKLDVSAQIINEKTYLPIRAVTEALGKELFWDDRGLIVITASQNKVDQAKDKGVIEKYISDLTPKVKGLHNQNIVNDGIIAKDGEWLYYSNFADNKKLYKMKIDGSEKTKLSEDQAKDINVFKGNIYYVGSIYNKDVYTGNAIYKINQDGKDKQKLTQGEISYMLVDGGKLYFVDYVRQYQNDLYKINLDGSGKTLIKSTMASRVNYFDDRIYYIGGMAETLEFYDINNKKDIYVKNGDFRSLIVTEDSIFYSQYSGIVKTNRDGKNEKTIAEDMASAMLVSGDWIYYINEKDYSNNIYKVKLDGTGRAKISSDKAYEINMIDGSIYYTVQKDGAWNEYNFYKINADGSGKQEIK